MGPILKFLLVCILFLVAALALGCGSQGSQLNETDVASGAPRPRLRGRTTLRRASKKPCLRAIPVWDGKRPGGDLGKAAHAYSLLDLARIAYSKGYRLGSE